MTERTPGLALQTEPTPPDLLEAQKRVLEMIVQNVPLAEVLESLCRIVEEQAPGVVRAAILLVTPDGGHLTTGAAPSLPESYSRAIDGIGISAFVGTCAAAAARRHVITTPDIANDPAWHRYKHLPLGLGLKAAWSLPIFSAAGAVLGTFGTYFTDPREPLPAERKLVEVLARTAGLAIERRRSDEALTADLKDMRLLRDLAARLIREEDTPAVFDEILAAAMTITEADAGTIQLLDTREHVLTFLARRGFVPDITSHFERVDACSHTSCGRALASGQRTFVVFDDPNAPDPGGSSKLHFEAGILSAQSTPLVSRSGKTLGMFSTHWRTHRQLGERELRFLDLLARQAADLIERTQSQDALRASEKQLREADRRKDEFIAVLAHELRNPLVPIRSGVELLKSAKERPVLIDTVRPMMERQVGHMVRLIDDLLDVSRITSGKIELQREPVTLASVVGSAIEANRSAIANRGLELSTNLDDPLRIIEVDPTRFSQVISNLVQNAAKFSEPGGRITLSALVQSGELVLQVADTGIGIEAEQLPKVFDLFVQAPIGRHDRQSGLGIGLALARSLVQLHGGSISASSPGIAKGSVFTIRVPMDDLGPREVAALRADQSLDGLRVLVVDDNRDAADAMALLVAQQGGEVRVGYSGSSALSVLDEFQASVVLLDIGMPGIDGYETCRGIRRKCGTSVYIVALTGWAQERDRQLAADAGFDTHITKPADPGQLAELLGARSQINHSVSSVGSSA